MKKDRPYYIEVETYSWSAVLVCIVVFLTQLFLNYWFSSFLIEKPDYIDFGALALTLFNLLYSYIFFNVLRELKTTKKYLVRGV